MNVRSTTLFLVAFMGLAGLLAGCGGGDGGPADHTVSMAGVSHKDGFTDPLVNCVECHGAQLAGGGGPSCYDCHSSADHAVNRGGMQHRDGSSDTCAACHGPANAGGLGPACSLCHG